MIFRRLLVLCCLTATLAGAEGRSPWPRLPLKTLPSLNEVLKNLPESRALEMVNSGTLAPAYEVVVDNVIWRVAVENRTGRVIMVRTDDPKFCTSEGVSVKTTVDSLRQRYPDAAAEEVGWGEWTNLPSGYCAFTVGPNETPSAGAKVKSLFKRCR